MSNLDDLLDELDRELADVSVYVPFYDTSGPISRERTTAPPLSFLSNLALQRLTPNAPGLVRHSQHSSTQVTKPPAPVSRRSSVTDANFPPLAPHHAASAKSLAVPAAEPIHRTNSFDDDDDDDFTNVNTQAAHTARKPVFSSAPPPATAPSTAALDSLLSDFDGLDVAPTGPVAVRPAAVAGFTPVAARAPSSSSSSLGAAASPAFTMPCAPLLLCSSSAPGIAGLSMSSRPCLHLRCAHCDHAVVRLDDCRWSANVDYFFFRNAVPDEGKLSARTEPARGAAAYCCQCAWRSVPAGAVENLTRAQAAGGVPVYRQEGEAQLGQLKWSCGVRRG